MIMVYYLPYDVNEPYMIRAGHESMQSEEKMDKERREKDVVDTIAKAIEYINTGDESIILNASESKSKAVLSFVVDLQRSMKELRETKTIEKG